MPPYEIERKYLIVRPVETLLQKSSRVLQITQTYLKAEEGTARVRRIEENGRATFVETRKKRITDLTRIEEEREISEEEYLELLKQRDPARQTIEKTRYCLPYEGHLFEIDVFPFWSRQAFMEVELTSEKESAPLPPEIAVIREVTADRQYTNHALAKKIPPED